MRTTRALLFAAAMTLLAACGGGGGESEELSGAELFIELGCQPCHSQADSDIAPTLHGVWGTDVTLQDGRTVTVDEAYVRKSITEPKADIVEGYDDRMPVFSLTDSEVDRLVDYVRSIG